MSTDYCKKILSEMGYNNIVKRGILCAGLIDGGRDACLGDSGGPLSVKRSEDDKWVLAGIISNGIKCGQPNIPGIYTQVSAYVDWIYQVINRYSST
jgi:secreted trypsin-like serine protease